MRIDALGATFQDSDNFSILTAHTLYSGILVAGSKAALVRLLAAAEYGKGPVT